MNRAFIALQDQIGCKNLWLAEMLGVSPEHISRLRNGSKPMSRQTELCMLALAKGFRP